MWPGKSEAEGSIERFVQSLRGQGLHVSQQKVPAQEAMLPDGHPLPDHNYDLFIVTKHPPYCGCTDAPPTNPARIGAWGPKPPGYVPPQPQGDEPPPVDDYRPLNEAEAKALDQPAPARTPGVWAQIYEAAFADGTGLTDRDLERIRSDIIDLPPEMRRVVDPPGPAPAWWGSPQVYRDAQYVAEDAWRLLLEVVRLRDKLRRYE